MSFNGNHTTEEDTIHWTFVDPSGGGGEGHGPVVKLTGVTLSDGSTIIITRNDIRAAEM